MIKALCKCSVCSFHVDEWIGEKCVSCYNDVIQKECKVVFDSELARVHKMHLDTQAQLRETMRRSEQAWSSYLDTYRNRLEVRMVDLFKLFFWSLCNIYNFVSSFFRKKIGFLFFWNSKVKG